MWRSGLLKPLKNAASCNLFFQIQRGLHSRNKKAKEYIGKGWSAIQEVDRVIPYTEPDDELLIPLLKSAKQNFELALEVDNLNTQARLWLARLHLKYCVPGACKAVGAGLLVEAADMGNADAQYELFCQLRTGESSITKDRQAVYYLDKAINQLQPDALFVLGAMHLGGDCVKKDLELAAWCFQKATQKGHVGAAIAYGALIFKGSGKVTSEASSKIRNRLSKRTSISSIDDAINQFEVAANAGNDLAFIWLNRLHEQEENEAMD
ncbi:uncharacterized protein LOC131050621 isoform X2 [Cryptomeria japonica]|uniref:uncharacterized protein LOC131050621 isoform X2 n=1 Tax=Cryptomeria japonica TaxID=3369 RepID=UPI0025ABF6FE|nr:uncharacterized protein LOC131050621 isoform X2 [Cryptomeria japonica]